ncbi:FP1, partial [Symbiodinium sp. KB8]
DKAHQRELNNEALRIYRLLRPEAPRFFEEDAMLGMKARMNQITQEDNQADPAAAVARAEKMADPFKAHLPVVNQKAFLLALESVVASLAEDLETLWHLLGNDPEDLPGVEDPLRVFAERFPWLSQARRRALQCLPPEEVTSGGARVYGAILAHAEGTSSGGLPYGLMGHRDAAYDIAGTSRGCQLAVNKYRSTDKNEQEGEMKEVEAWLTGHLELLGKVETTVRRVTLNQRRYEQADQKIFLHTKRSQEEYYNFAEDFPYDDDPMPGLLADERNLDFPLDKAQEYMQLFLGALGASQRAQVTRSDEELGPADLVWDLEEVGLRNWLKMDIQELENNLPKGEMAQLIHATTAKGQDTSSKLYFDDDDVKVAKLMLHCAARGKADLLDFEAVDPYKLLHGMPAADVQEELASLPPNPHLGDDQLSTLVDEHCRRLSATEDKD